MGCVGCVCGCDLIDVASAHADPSPAIHALTPAPAPASAPVPVPASAPAPATAALKNVQHCIAISSCKGGVGKSTVAVNLACELASRGLRVGLLDGDIYGPSVPVLLPARDLAVKKSPNAGQGGLPGSTVVPLVSASLPNLKMLSFGHVNSNAGVAGAGAGSAAVVRGPVASRVVSQLVGSTEWGCLDYLLVDMPPGTVRVCVCVCLCLYGCMAVCLYSCMSVCVCAPRYS